MTHIADGDFTPVIEAALAAPGFAADAPDKYITVGFGRNAVMGVAGKVIDLVKQGKIRHFFLIGGCDGAKPGRNYYTEFAEQVPKDCVILTLACGKYRFNKLEFGQIEGIPRLLDCRPVQRRLLRRADRGGAGRGVRLRRERSAAVAGPVLVRAEGRGDSADAAVPGHQGHPARPEPAGVRDAGGAERARGQVRDQADQHCERRFGGHVACINVVRVSFQMGGVVNTMLTAPPIHESGRVGQRFVCRGRPPCLPSFQGNAHGALPLRQNGQGGDNGRAKYRQD